jgi:hypothetical protein
VNREAKLYKLVVSELGFSQESRSFQNALNSNQNINEQGDTIDNVTLKDFLITFGTVYEIVNCPSEYLQNVYSSKNNQSFQLHSSSDEI